VQECKSKRPGDGGGGEYAEQDCAANFLHFESNHEDEAEEGEVGGGATQVAETDEGFRIGDDETGVAEADEGDEQADAAGHGRVELMGNGAQNHLADAGGGEGEEDDSRKKNRAQRCLPGDVHLKADGVSEVGVEAHAGGERNGIAGDDAHEDGTEGGRQAGGGGDRCKGHAGGREDGRVDQDNVSHGQEGGDAGQDLGTPVGPQASEFKIGFNLLEHRRVLLEEHKRGSTQSDLCGFDGIRRHHAALGAGVDIGIRQVILKSNYNRVKFI